jgi:hypothetical protein
MKKYLLATNLLLVSFLSYSQLTYDYDLAGNRIKRYFISAPLPLNLITFEGKRFEQSVILNWQTTNETNFSHFEVEKSLNTAEFGVIGQVLGLNTKQGIYSFTDSKPTIGSINYYRLRMIDNDGKTTMSKIISVQFDAETTYLSVENPVSNNEISVSTNITNPIFSLTNSIGNKLTISVTELGQAKYKIKTSAPPIGIYILSIQTAKEIINRKLILR